MFASVPHPQIVFFGDSNRCPLVLTFQHETDMTFGLPTDPSTHFANGIQPLIRGGCLSFFFSGYAFLGGFKKRTPQ